MPGQGGPRGALGVGPPQAVTRTLTVRLPETAKVKQRYACLLEECDASCCAVYGGDGLQSGYKGLGLLSQQPCSRQTTRTCSVGVHPDDKRERQKDMLCSLLTCLAVLERQSSWKLAQQRGHALTVCAWNNYPFLLAVLDLTPRMWTNRQHDYIDTSWLPLTNRRLVQARGKRKRAGKDMDMEVTFTPGLEGLGARLLAQRREASQRKGDTVWEAYLRRQK